MKQPLFWSCTGEQGLQGLKCCWERFHVFQFNQILVNWMSRICCNTSASLNFGVIFRLLCAQREKWKWLPWSLSPTLIGSKSLKYKKQNLGGKWQKKTTKRGFLCNSECPLIAENEKTFQSLFFMGENISKGENKLPGKYVHNISTLFLSIFPLECIWVTFWKYRLFLIELYWLKRSMILLCWQL